VNAGLLSIAINKPCSSSSGILPKEKIRNCFKKIIREGVHCAREGTEKDIPGITRRSGPGTICHEHQYRAFEKKKRYVLNDQQKRLDDLKHLIERHWMTSIGFLIISGLISWIILDWFQPALVYERL